MYKSTDTNFAVKYWHWFFFIQPYPTPEKLLEHNPGEFIKDRLAVAGDFDSVALEAYTSMGHLPGCVEGMVRIVSFLSLSRAAETLRIW